MVTEKYGNLSVKAKLEQARLSERLLMVIVYTTMVFFIFVTLYPFLHIASVSLSSAKEAIKPGMHFFPSELTFTSYRKVLSMPLLGTSYRNTMIVVIFGTTFNMLVTILAAYPLSRKYLVFRKSLILYIVFTMLFSGGLIPSYLLMRSLGLVNNRLVLILTGLVSPYNMIIMKNFFQSIPESLEESAKMDGASDYRVLKSIILPLSTPVLATIGLFYAVGHWNAFFTCLIYISDTSKIVLQVLLRQLVITSELQINNQINNIDIIMANSLPIQDKSTVIIVATVPILAIYPFLQKYFVKGVMIGAIKG